MEKLIVPLFAILHVDPQGLHRHSCTLVEAASLAEIAQHMLTYPDAWQAVLEYVYPNDDDCRSLRIRIGAGNLTPDELLKLISQTEIDQHFAEMLRIYPIEVQTLNRLQIRTRLLNGSDGQIHSSNTLLTESMPTITTESSLSQLLSAYTALERQKRREITAQLQQIHDRSTQQIQVVQQQERKLVGAQAELLDQLRLQLAVDARSLLLTPNFQEYLHTLLEQNIWQYSQLRFHPIPLDAADWLLPTLEFRVQLNDIEWIGVDDSSAVTQTIGLSVQVGLWQQNLKIPTSSVEDDNFDYRDTYDIEQQWLNAGQCLQQKIESEPFEFVISPNLSSAQHSQLILELTCLLAYVAQLFNLDSIATPFRYP